MPPLFFNQKPEHQTVEVSADPRPGVSVPPADVMKEWLEKDAEVIDLGSTQRDRAIMPTTWHA